MSNTSLTTKVSQSRGWTLALGIGAAVLAAILLIAYLVQYRSSVNDSTAPTPVLVAKNLIPKGTSGTVIAEKQLFQAATLREGRPQGRRDLRPRVPERPRRGGGHLPRPADHDGRPQRRPDRRDPDAAHRASSGPSRSRSAAHAGLVGYVASGDRVDVYYEARRRRRQRPRPPRARTSSIMRAPRRGPAGDPPRRGAAGTEARVRVRHRHAVVPAAAGGWRQERRRSGRSRAQSSSQQINGQPGG